MIFNSSSCFSLRLFPVKGEKPECVPTLNVLMSASFAIIGSITSTTREFETILERKLKGALSLKRKNLLRRVVDLKITLILQKGRFLLILSCKPVLIARDKLPRYGRAINNFFLTANATGVCKNFLVKKVLMQLSPSLMRNALFLKISFKRLTFVWNLEKSGTMKMF